jgi:hypothetical protein
MTRRRRNPRYVCVILREAEMEGESKGEKREDKLQEGGREMRMVR